MAKKIVIEETKTVTTKKPTVVNRVTSRKALGSSPITSDNEVTNDSFAKQIKESKNKIVWFEAIRKSGSVEKSDVTIVKGEAKKQKWNFTLRNEYVYTFGKMIQVGTFGNKLFFKEVFVERTLIPQLLEHIQGTAPGTFNIQKSVCSEHIMVELSTMAK